MLNISSIESNKLITTELCPLPKPLQDTQNCLFSVAIPETGATITPLVHVSLSQILQTNHHYHVSVFLGNQAGKVSSTGHVPISKCVCTIYKIVFFIAGACIENCTGATDTAGLIPSDYTSNQIRKNST